MGARSRAASHARRLADPNPALPRPSQQPRLPGAVVSRVQIHVSRWPVGTRPAQAGHRTADALGRLVMLAVAPFSGDANEWNGFVRSQPGWSHFHQYGWKHAIERAFGHECIYLGARNQSQLVGVLPLVRVKSVLFGHY